jgi:hypothetical protein
MGTVGKKATIIARPPYGAWLYEITVGMCYER